MKVEAWILSKDYPDWTEFARKRILAKRNQVKFIVLAEKILHNSIPFTLSCQLHINVNQELGGLGRETGEMLSPFRLGRILARREFFRSKSGGFLHVMVQLNKKEFDRFFGKTGTLRIYRVSDIPRGGMGANEFHKHRSEIVTAEKGTFRLELEDIRGKVKTVKLHEGTTYGTIPPFVLHTYIALTDHASLHVVANTLYDHYRPATYDTCSVQEFRKLQARI